MKGDEGTRPRGAAGNDATLVVIPPLHDPSVAERDKCLAGREAFRNRVIGKGLRGEQEPAGVDLLDDPSM